MQLSPSSPRPRDPFALAADLLDPPVDPYAADPVGYATDVLGFWPWSKQRQILESVRDHARTSVRACHGVGKTAGAAQVGLWFLGTHSNSRVVTTAPTWAQVEQLLWREIRSAVGRAHAAGKGDVFPRPSTTKLEIGDEWFAIGLSTNEPERFQGHHADHLLLIVDEASGVDEKIYEAAEGFMTADGAKMLLIGNPTRIGGTFHRSHTAERATWNQIHVSVFDSPNYTGEQVPEHVARALPRAGWAEERALAWGVETPMYQVRVLGNFPTSSEDTVIGLGTVEDAQAREIEPHIDDPVVIGVDVARFGDDETVITERRGQHVRIVEHYRGSPTTHTSGRVAHYARQHMAARIVVDDTGVGGGVTDQLRAEGFNVTAFNASDQAFDPRDFPNRRSELWFQAAEMLEDVDLDPDDQLCADLTSPKYTYDLKMRRVVEKKADTKKRLGRSPDRADSVLLTFVPERSLGAMVAPPQQARTRRADQRESSTMSVDSLMHDPM